MKMKEQHKTSPDDLTTYKFKYSSVHNSSISLRRRSIIFLWYPDNKRGFINNFISKIFPITFHQFR